MSTQIDQIIHAPDFLRLEASWRGLARLVKETASIPVRVGLLDLQRAALHDSTALDAISRETDLWGGSPVKVIVNDFPMVRQKAASSEDLKADAATRSSVRITSR